MYTTDHILPVIPIKHLANQDGEPTMPHKLATDTKKKYQTYMLYSVHVLFKRQLRILKQRRYTCVINHKKDFVGFRQRFHKNLFVIYDTCITPLFQDTQLPFEQHMDRI